MLVHESAQGAVTFADDRIAVGEQQVLEALVEQLAQRVGDVAPDLLGVLAEQAISRMGWAYPWAREAFLAWATRPTPPCTTATESARALATDCSSSTI